MFAVMTIIFVFVPGRRLSGPNIGNNPMVAKGVAAAGQTSGVQPGGNMEGKEVRFGITNSALWATATTATSNGSVNSMHDSFMPLGGLVPLLLIHLGEVIYGGVGSGLYGMLVFVIIAVFVARADGRQDAGIPGQEGRVVRDEDGLARCPDPGILHT